MNTARIVDLTIVKGAGGIAAFLASGLACQADAPTEPVAQLRTRQALPQTAATARNSINPRGEGLGAVRHGAARRQAMQT